MIESGFIWGELMSDSVIATAILDRLLHHAHVLNPGVGHSGQGTHRP